MHWYLVHTKPRQETLAQQNLERQGYQCYLPTLRMEKLESGRLQLRDVPLFPRYLFIRLGLDNSSKSWSPIRSTKGVSQLVSFGLKPARIDDRLVDLLKTHESTIRNAPERLFKQGERVMLTEGAFSGVEGIYQMADGERRVLVLIELMTKTIVVPAAPASLCKVG